MGLSGFSSFSVTVLRHSRFRTRRGQMLKASRPRERGAEWSCVLPGVFSQPGLQTGQEVCQVFAKVWTASLRVMPHRSAQQGVPKAQEAGERPFYTPLGAGRSPPPFLDPKPTHTHLCFSDTGRKSPVGWRDLVLAQFTPTYHETLGKSFPSLGLGFSVLQQGQAH